MKEHSCICARFRYLRMKLVSRYTDKEGRFRIFRFSCDGGCTVIVLFIIYSFAFYVLKKVFFEGCNQSLGELGDIFGGLNVVYTGFAFIGLLATIILQRQELSLTRKEFKEQTSQFKIQANIMTMQVLDGALFEYLQYMCSIKREDKVNENISSAVVQAIFIQKELEVLLSYEDIDKAPVWERPENFIYDGNPEYCLPEHINCMRGTLENLSSWRRVLTSWFIRVNQTHIPNVGDSDEEKNEVEENRAEYKKRFWHLLSKNERFVIYLQTALYAHGYHKDDWAEMRALFQDEVIIADKFAELKFDKKSKDILFLLLEEPPVSHAERDLSIERIKEIIKNYRSENC